MAKKIKNTETDKDKEYPLAPHYPKNEDIYNKEKEEELDIDDNTGKISTGKKTIPQSMGLDVPGAEADDENEAIGEEDEENNYYSLGGDDHENLEEDKNE